MIQLQLDLPHRAALGRPDFLISPANATALDWIDRWPDWPGRALALHGPAECGKTHLAHIWCERSGGRLLSGPSLTEANASQLDPASRPALAIDDAETAPEEPLLHLYNFCRECEGTVLLLSRSPPALWPAALPSLVSRLRAALAIAVSPPDDALLGAVLLKHFADRQIRVAPEVIRYLVPRMERSFAAAASLADRLDRAALGAGAAITIPLAGKILSDGRT
ncbi:MAG: DNA replication protein [Alphaproteobacteria bacterium]|nr:DNA replication protein [Alphaproteobacteria bacterium]